LKPGRFLLVVGAILGKINSVESATIQRLTESIEATSTSPRDRVWIVRAAATRGGRPRISGHGITVSKPMI
jgi:hypothetical protein